MNKMTLFNINKIDFSILLLFIEQCLTNNIYKIPFGIYNSQNSNNSLDITDNIFYNSIYINLSIGTPPQIIPFALSINSQTFSAPSNLFNKNVSSTYESVSQHEIRYEHEDVIYGYNSKDILNLNNNTKQKINFILGTKYGNNNNILGIVGLLIPKRVQFGVSPFFQSLRNAGFIKSYTWTLKFFDNVSLADTILYNKNKSNIIGEFIFGDEPHNYENDRYKYNVTEYLKVSPISTGDTLYWDLEFNSIYLTKKENDEKNTFSKIIIQGEKKVQIMPDVGFMIGPSEFFHSIKNNFFNEYFKNNICRQKKINIYLYYYIECNYTSLFRIYSFPTITFEHIGFESTFNMTYKDLFIVDKKKDRYIFLIFQKDFFSNWVLGNIFLRKFQFIYNVDYKTIGYYKSINYNCDNIQNKNIENKIKNNKFKYSAFIFLLIIFSVLLILFGMFCQKKFFNKNRKIRANELEENFSYESNSKKNKNKSIINEEENEQKYHSI